MRFSSYLLALVLAVFLSSMNAIHVMKQQVLASQTHSIDTFEHSNDMVSIIRVPSDEMKKRDYVTLDGLRKKAYDECKYATYVPKIVLGAYTYSKDGLARVTQVVGVIQEGKVNSHSDAATKFVDAVYYHHTCNWGACAGLDGDKFEVGHIVAASLNGDEQDPLNFFPQHRNSNQGVYKRIEAIAANVRLQLTLVKDDQIDPKKPPIACTPYLTITYQYSDVKDLMPTGGTYTIETSKDCAEELLKAASTYRFSTYVLAYLTDIEKYIKAGALVGVQFWDGTKVITTPDRI